MLKNAIGNISTTIEGNTGGSQQYSMRSHEKLTAPRFLPGIESVS